MIKYTLICDRCGRNVENPSGKGERVLYHRWRYYDLCKECEDQYEELRDKQYQEIDKWLGKNEVGKH